MTHYLEISHAAPVRFYPVDVENDERYNSIHLDNDWFFKQIRWFEKNIFYHQKWQQNDQLSLQVRSTLTPVEIDILDCSGKKIVENIPLPFVPVSKPTGDYNVYEGTIDFNTIVPGATPLPDGEYYLLLSAGTDETFIYALSEPIHVKAKWPKTMLFEYTHDRNDYDIWWETGITCNFRVEAILTELTPKRNRTSYENQVQQIQTLRSDPYRKWKLKIGGEGGVPAWVADKLNFIFGCSSIKADGLLICPDEGAELEPQFVNDYPAASWSIDVREGLNKYSKRITTDGELNAAFLTVFNLNSWTWFGSLGGDANSQPVRIQKEI